MTRKMKKMLIIPVGLAAVALFAFLGGQSVRLLWNWLLPPLFGWREVTFWQALGLLALCRILFGGFGRHGGGPKMDMRRRVGDALADRVAHRWGQMTTEERERFRQSLRERLGFDPQNPPPA